MLSKLLCVEFPSIKLLILSISICVVLYLRGKPIIPFFSETSIAKLAFGFFDAENTIVLLLFIFYKNKIINIYLLPKNILLTHSII